MAKIPPIEIPVELVTKIERIKVATILPGDVVFLHFPEDCDTDTATECAEWFALTTRLPNAIVPFCGDLRVEIVHPKTSEPSPSAWARDARGEWKHIDANSLREQSDGSYVQMIEGLPWVALVAEDVTFEDPSK